MSKKWLQFQTKFLKDKLKWDNNTIRNFLVRLWDELIRHEIIIRYEEGDGYVLNSEKIYFKSGKNKKIGYCSTCGAHDYYNIRGHCTTQNCNGKINYIEDKENYFKYYHYYVACYRRQFV